MPKQNPMLAKIDAKYAAKYAHLFAEAKEIYNQRVNVVLQMTCDAALIAYGQAQEEETQITPSEFQKNFCNVFNEIVKLLAEDDGDKEATYSIAKVDEAVEKYVGDDFKPWGERYSLCLKREVANWF